MTAMTELEERLAGPEGVQEYERLRTRLEDIERRLWAEIGRGMAPEDYRCWAATHEAVASALQNLQAMREK